MTDADRQLDLGVDPGPRAPGQLGFVDEIEAANPEEEARRLTGEWIGLPMFGDNRLPPKVVVSFDSDAERRRFLDEYGFTTIHKNTKGTLSVWWPPREREDLASLRFEQADDEIALEAE